MELTSIRFFPSRSVSSICSICIWSSCCCFFAFFFIFFFLFFDIFWTCKNDARCCSVNGWKRNKRTQKPNPYLAWARLWSGADWKRKCEDRSAKVRDNFHISSETQKPLTFPVKKNVEFYRVVKACFDCSTLRFPIGPRRNRNKFEQ